MADRAPESSPDAALSARRFNPVVGAYAAALLSAVAAIWWLRDSATDTSLLLTGAVADLVATVVIFGFSLGFRNSSFYDPYWSVVPPLLFGYWWWLAPPLPADGLLRLMLMALLTAWWAFRLTHNWARGWQGLGHEDWRYRDLQAKTGPFYWLVSLLGIHLLPTVWVFIGCLPMYLASGAALADGAVLPLPEGAAIRSLGWLDGLALLVGGAAIWLEGRADNELRAFRANRRSSAELLRSGVWAWCRHPNYLGEIGFWLALALFGAAAQPGAWWVWLGPLVMVLLFAGLTIRMIEQKLAAAKPGYADYQRTTAMLIPRPARRRP